MTFAGSGDPLFLNNTIVVWVCFTYPEFPQTDPKAIGVRTKIEASIFKGMCHLKIRKASILGALSNTILAIRTRLWPYGKVFKKNCKTELRAGM